MKTSTFRVLAVSALANMAMAAPTPSGVGLCNSLGLGHGPSPSEDSSSNFQAFEAFKDAATSAVTPAGYLKSFANLNVTYNEPKMFVGYTELATYNVQACATACNATVGCNAFNIFFERSPTLDPGAGCPNPASTTLIKCDLWRGTITPDMTMNYGQFKEEFHVVMAGSNAYVKNVDGAMPVIPGYTTEAYLDGGAIQAPLDCHNKDTYLGVQKYFDARFDAQRCVDFCTTNLDCNYVNTYMLRKDGVPFAQHCAMYTSRWTKVFATNHGQVSGDDDLTISNTDSYGFTRNDGGDHDACVLV